MGKSVGGGLSQRDKREKNKKTWLVCTFLGNSTETWPCIYEVLCCDVIFVHQIGYQASVL